MIRINLLPYRAARKKENIRIQVNVFIGSIVIALLLIWWINSFLAGRIDRLNTQIADTKDQVAKYKKIMDEIAEIKKKLSLLDRKIEVIKSLEADSKAPVENLDSLYHVLVEKKMWYTKIEEKNKTFKVQGIALDNHSVADYMTRIEKSDQFQNVVLSSVKQHTLKDKSMKLKQFEVKFQNKPVQKQVAEGKK
ncbi:MAG: PilN domain-containing protein [Desulfobacteraceae bacterium]|jgi:type IV pilus assembly protein PilN